MTQAAAPSERRWLTVSELATRISSTLDREFGAVWVRGEIGSLTAARSGHVYFCLKDAGSQLQCVAFRSTVGRLSFKLTERSEILLRGRAGIYPARGDLQLIVDWAEPVGVGSLQAELERLKRKLHAEGLFAQERKRPLPYLPRCVAVVTSPSGAAIRDVLAVLRRRNPALLVRIVPAPVQGAGAGAELARALALADEHAGAEVIVLTRGGGSAEDLSCFNDEALARAIARCRTPVVSAVGHEVDTTIADYVADRRAPTPSAAAEMVTPVSSELLLQAAALRGRLDHAMGSFFSRRAMVLRDLGARLQSRSPRRRISDGLLRLDELDSRLERAVRRQLELGRTRMQALSRALMRPGPRSQIERARSAIEAAGRALAQATHRRLDTARSRLEQARAALQALNPLAVLERGFAIVRRDGQVVTDTEALRPGARVRVQLARGAFSATVDGLEPAARGAAPEGDS
jgi:exodeoxyribonuclease VII large subunit